MTPHGKVKNIGHGCYFPTEGASVRTRAPVEGAHHDNFAAFWKLNYLQLSSRGTDVTLFHSGTRADSARHCGAGMPARSRSLLRGGVSSWDPNQRHEGVAGQSVLGKKTSLSLCSAAASSSRRAASSLATGSPSKSTSRAASARRATPTSSSPAGKSLTRKLCMRSMALCSPNECRSESNQRRDRSAGWPKAPVRLRSVPVDRLRVGEPTRIGRLSWPALGRTSNVGERGVTGRRDAHLIHCSGGAAAARLAHNQEVVGSIPTPATSSGDGLGIHQPGSNTRGFASARQPASGRAAEAAMCPAVARSFQGRAA